MQIGGQLLEEGRDIPYCQY